MVNNQSPLVSSDRSGALSLVVFDVDGTLYDVNTLYGFLERYHAGQSWTKYTFFRLSRSLPGKVFWFLLTKLTRCELFRELAFRSLRGTLVACVANACREYVAEVLPQRERVNIMGLLQHYRKEGCRVVLVSGSAQPIIEEIGRILRVDACLAVELDAVDGHYTGQLTRDIRGRKLDVLRKAYPHLKDFVVVTDNKEDLEIVRAASQAWVISKPKNKSWWEGQDLTNTEIIEV